MSFYKNHLERAVYVKKKQKLQIKHKLQQNVSLDYLCYIIDTI